MNSMLRRVPVLPVIAFAVFLLLGCEDDYDLEDQYRETLTRIHTDLSIPIHSHEPESRINSLVDNREVQPVALGNAPPVADPYTAEGINPHLDLRAANSLSRS